MSGDPAPGYLARLVTRMTDEPAIRPRVASRFEVGGGGQRGLEVTTETREAPDAALDEARPARAVSATDPAGRPSPRDQAPVAAPHRDLAAVVRRLTADNAPGIAERAAARRGDRASSGGVRASGQPEPSRAADATDPDPGPLRAGARAVTPTTVGEAVPTRYRIRAAARSDSPDATSRVDRREPDVVQVHIGRVEVRAIGAAPTSPTPIARPTVGLRPLPLDRYLAGERRS